MYLYHILASSLWGDFIVALAGAIIGGMFTLLGSYIANRHQASIENDNEKIAVKDFVHSIHDELELAWALYFQNVGRLLETSPDRQPFAYPWRASNNYFRIYESNLGLLPKISNTRLRKKIIKTYFYANSLIDSLHMNTDMLGEAEHLDSLSKQFGDAGGQHYAALNNKLAQLANYRDELFRVHTLAKESMNELFPIIEEWTGK